MLKYLSLVIILAAGAASAQTVPTHGTSGRAILADSNMRRATTRFDVAGFAANTLVRGTFTFASPASNVADRSVGIEMLRPTRLAVNGRTADFTGPAVMTFRTPLGTSRVQGTVVVQVFDGRRPGEPSTGRDTLRVQFVSPTTNASFSYFGAAVEGDLVVFDRRG